MRRTLAGVTIALISLSVVYWADDFWRKKDYNSWTPKECEELLSRSPWTFRYTETNFYSPATNISAGTETLTPGQQAASLEPQTGQRESRISFQFTLMSAKPIRMARGRLSLVQAPQMKEQVEQFINQPPGKEILFQLSYFSQPPGISALHDIHNYFRRATINDFQSSMTLTSSETKTPVHIIRYEPPDERKAYAILAFPRYQADGQPFFTGKEKSITLRSELNIPIAQRGTLQRFSVFVKLEPKKMFFQNEFAL